MINEQGRVVKIEDGSAWVEILRAESCGYCSKGVGCGFASISALFGRHDRLLRVANDCDANVGDSVTLGIPESSVVRGSMIVYLMPLALMFVFAFGGQMIAQNMELTGQETITTLAGLLGLGVGLARIKPLSRHLEDNKDFQISITRTGSPLTGQES